MKALKVMVLFDTAGPPPADQDFTEEFKTEEWMTEANVVRAVRELGHEISMVGAYEDINLVIHGVRKYKPDIVFNLMEHFRGEALLDRSIPALFELMNVPYTGTGPTGLTLCRNKALSKEILSYHRIRTPKFFIVLKNRQVFIPRNVKFPFLVKPLREDGSTGIAQSSFVTTLKALKERVEFVHESLDHDAIVEEYIDGREFYVSILGNDHLRVFPFREIRFGNVGEKEPKIASYKTKWDKNYRKRRGIRYVFASPFAAPISEKMTKVCKRVYQLLKIRGYGRIDLRLTPDNEVVVIEANPNPHIDDGEDYAESAKKGGIEYNDLIQRIINLGLHAN